MNVRRFTVRIWIHTRSFQFLGLARSTPQFLTAVQSLKLSHLTKVYVLMDCQLFNFRYCVLETLSSKPTKETSSVTLAKESFRFIHILIIVFFSQLTTLHPTFQQLTLNQCGSDRNNQQRTKPTPKARHKNAQSRFELVV